MTAGDVRVVFMGSPAFAVPSLRALVEAGYRVPLVVCQPDRPAGRGARVRMPAVKEFALGCGLEVFQPETLKDEAVVARFAAAEPDVFVVAAYGRIIPRALLAVPRRGSLNVHASLLPRWRGASPVEAAILAGDPETGVSIMEVVPKMDAGPVVAQVTVPIAPDATTRTLEPQLAEAGARLLATVLPGWFAHELPALPQDEAEATYCSLITKEDGHLAATMSAVEAERAVRAYDPWPGAFVRYRGARLGIWRAHVEPLPGTLPVGALVRCGRSPAIAFADGLLVLDEVQREGARRVAGEAFLNGERGHLAREVELRA